MESTDTSKAGVASAMSMPSDDDWDGDPIEFCEDVATTALRLAIVLAVLVGSALFCAGVLTGMWVAS